MRRVLIIPAAGHGTRLGSNLPKVLVPVAGTPMLDRLLRLYESVVDAVVLVVNPASKPLIDRHLASRPHALPVESVVQDTPTGMLDAILLARSAAARHDPSSVWVTWCDQVAVHPNTIERLAERTNPHRAGLVMPTVISADPYIHLERGPDTKIVRVLHRREGDAMPEVGESDMGLFAMSAEIFFDRLPCYAADVEIGASTGERNFLPFIASIERDADASTRDGAAVETFPCEDPIEAVGVNTPDDLARLERYFTR